MVRLLAPVDKLHLENKTVVKIMKEIALDATNLETNYELLFECYCLESILLKCGYYMYVQDSS